MIRCLIPDLPQADELVPWLRRIDASRWYSNFGPLVSEFESALKGFLQTHSGGDICLTTLSSGASALELAIASLHLPHKSRVLIPAFSFATTGTALLRCGMQPLFGDVDPRNWQLTPEIAHEARRQVPYDLIIPVATFGTPLPAASWDAFHRDTSIPVILDAAGAFGDQQIGRDCAVVFSFHATKPFGIGEGGLFVSRDLERTERVRGLSNHGLNQGIVHYPGTNAKLSEYHAAVGLAQLLRWDGIRATRKHLWESYRQKLAASPLVRLQQGIGPCGPSLFSVLLPCAAASVAGLLLSAGIETRRWYCPSLIHHPCFRESVSGLSAADPPLAATEKLESLSLGIPFHSHLTEEQISRICERLLSTLTALPSQEDP